MTKRRPPLTFHQAIDRIAGRVGYAEMASATGRAERTVRNWSDPDTGALPSIQDAFELDRLYLQSGGPEAPMMSVLALKLELTTMAVLDVDALATLTARACKEAGEALAALVDASHNHTSAAHIELARRETVEAIDALTAALRQLACAGAGPNVHHLAAGDRRATGPPA